jgi:hypothetical protein
MEVKPGLFNGDVLGLACINDNILLGDVLDR